MDGPKPYVATGLDMSDDEQVPEDDYVSEDEHVSEDEQVSEEEEPVSPRTKERRLQAEADGKFHYTRIKTEASGSKIDKTTGRVVYDVGPAKLDRIQSLFGPGKTEKGEAEEKVSRERAGLRRTSRPHSRVRIRGQFVCPLCHEDFSRVGLLNHL